jgi:hypothetical protein
MLTMNMGLNVVQNVGNFMQQHDLKTRNTKQLTCHIQYLRYSRRWNLDCGLLRYDTVRSGMWLPKFRRNILPPSQDRSEPWRWRQQASQKCWYPAIKLQAAITQNTTIQIYSYTVIPCFSRSLTQKFELFAEAPPMDARVLWGPI